MKTIKAWAVMGKKNDLVGDVPSILMDDAIIPLKNWAVFVISNTKKAVENWAHTVNKNYKIVSCKITITK